MPEKIGIKGNYIQVKRSGSGEITYGGDQGFLQEERKRQSGCGVIAFGDLTLYLASRDGKYLTTENKSYVNQVLAEERYKEYFDRIYDLMGGIFWGNGVSGLKLWTRFNRMARQNGWRLRAKWGISRRKVLPRIEEMIKKDIPVILCVPLMLRKKSKNDKLPFYVRKALEEKGEYVYRKAQATSGHYVTVTGVVKEKEDIYLVISSWGKEYYINYQEYDTYISTHFLGTILGNILYIR